VQTIQAPWGGEIVVYSRRSPQRIWLPRGTKVYGAARRTALRLPLAVPEQLALDLAAVLRDRELRHALANLEYRGIIDLGVLPSACAAGRPGSAALRRAIAVHDPRHARTNSPWEDELLVLCERHRIPKPDEMDTYIAGLEVDAVWHAAKLIVEIDGRDNHRTWAQAVRDRGNELTLRGLGYTVLRYTRTQLEREAERVAAEIAQHLTAA
jgi:very-short-patch-repair endonuclease